MPRIAKLIAHSGLCSRREAERWIEQGRVKVDGVRITSAALDVSPEQEIRVDGKLLAEPEKAALWMFHKPKGCITSRKDEKNRQTVYDFLPPEMQQLHTVGRLDFNSEGLLLLTNHPPLKRYLELPSTGWKRLYRVRVHGRPSDATLQQLAKGVTIEGIRYKPIEVTIESSADGKTPSNVWLQVTLTEGKNREIRKVFEHFGHPVSRLIRIGYGPFRLGKLPLKAVNPIKRPVLKSSVPAEVL